MRVHHQTNLQAAPVGHHAPTIHQPNFLRSQRVYAQPASIDAAISAEFSTVGSGAYPGQPSLGILEGGVGYYCWVDANV